MSSGVVLGTSLTQELHNRVQAKVAEMGWSSGGEDDSALTEYIILMLQDNKEQNQIANELSTELLGLAPDDAGTLEFARWLFEQIAALTNQAGQQESQLRSSDVQADAAQDGEQAQMGDEEMNDAGDTIPGGAVPTGPKSMRDAPQKNRDKRMLGQMNRQMNRTPDAALHRIQGTKGTGRINSHHGRDPPKGPAPKGPRGGMNRGAGMPNQRQMNGSGMPQMPQMPQMAGNSSDAFGTMTPQQQMQLFAMYEQQAQMMSQLFSPQQQQQIFGGQMGMPPQQQSKNAGKSLFDRVEGKTQNQNGNFNRRQQNNNEHIANSGDMDISSSMEVENSSTAGGKPDPTTTVCRFNLSCSKPDCPFVHQSPAAPPGVAIDMDDECSFGAACKNRKCVGKHPSPAKRISHLAEVDCKYFPNCTNPTCPFRHPSMPPCRNGADCKVQDCKFSHSKVVCKYNPCMNPVCPFKHEEGQKRGAFEDKVWINSDENDEEGKKQHVSERKFVEETTGDEELILPGKAAEEETPAEGIVT